MLVVKLFIEGESRWITGYTFVSNKADIYFHASLTNIYSFIMGTYTQLSIKSVVVSSAILTPCWMALT